jgi:LPS export ABC transporter protein LptC
MAQCEKFATCCWQRQSDPAVTLPSSRTVSAFVLLLAAALISTYIVSSVEDDDTTDTRPKLSVAYFLDKAQLTGTDKDGKILYQVWAQHAEQSKTEQHINLTKVRMVYGPPTALPWEVRADMGYIPADAAVIELHGNVVASSVDEGSLPTIIRTERLDVNPATRDAMTTEDVTLEYGGRIIDATGMQANFETNDLKLLSNVHGRFLPQ